jgi:D-alanine transaminase
MSMAYLNGDFLPLQEARISPLDRGFLFGDGIYEVIPSHGGRMIGCEHHLRRMQDGLAALEIDAGLDGSDWGRIAQTLLDAHGAEHAAVYLQVSRGADSKRGHAYPVAVQPTCFGYAFDIPPAPQATVEGAHCYRVSSTRDLRWQRCQIKSTALLGNVLHYREAQRQGLQEILLFNAADELTEAAACNVFVVNAGAVATPPLDHQLLPGVTRALVLEILRAHSDLTVSERRISRAEVLAADEVWLTSSSKEIAPVIEIDGHSVGTGRVGPVWLQAQALFNQHKFDY